MGEARYVTPELSRRAARAFQFMTADEKSGGIIGAIEQAKTWDALPVEWKTLIEHAERRASSY